jgi:hypothetical protein
MLLVGAGVVVAAGAQSAAAAGWSIQPVPLPPRPADISLSGVSCPSTRDCTAVGDAKVIASGNDFPLIEHWNGTAWSIEPSPVPPLSDGGGALASVSCTSSDACIAVGSFGPQQGPLAERWNGSAWSLQRPPGALTASEFDGVSCASSTDCVAVGDEEIAERWDGHRWTAQNTRFNDAQGIQSGLLGVSCPSRTTCAAVGADDIGLCTDPYDYGSGFSDYDVPLLGFWTSGRWSLHRHPDIACGGSSARGVGNGLDAVSCTSATACTAVGSQIYRWNGSRWSMQSAPIGTQSLFGVSCTSTTACTAVGSRIYTWNGRAWASQAIPRPARAANVTLGGVSCISPQSCVAVGSYDDQQGDTHLLVVSIGMGR